MRFKEQDKDGPDQSAKEFKEPLSDGPDRSEKGFPAKFSAVLPCG
jgi:hypothetical protein